MEQRGRTPACAVFGPFFFMSDASSISQPAAGAWPVMLTPFTTDRRIDWAALDRLIEWYLAADVDGLFAVCFSSELFHLTSEERLAVAARTVARVRGRVPVIAAGALGEGDEPLAAAARGLADTGVSAVVFLTNQFAAESQSEPEWCAAAERCLERLDPAIPLGLYECPLPYKRLLRPSTVLWAARTGRFRFFKDTCCNLVQIEEKIRALAASPLRFYNANTDTLLPSLMVGGHGFSGVGANAVPHLYAWLCRHFRSNPQQAQALQRFLVESAPAVDLKYPHSVKTYLSLFGVPMEPVCRMREATLETSDLERLRAFHRAVAGWEEQLGLVSPFALLNR